MALSDATFDANAETATSGGPASPAD